jgi:hypothetical protein
MYVVVCFIVVQSVNRSQVSILTTDIGAVVDEGTAVVVVVLEAVEAVEVEK